MQNEVFLKPYKDSFFFFLIHFHVLLFPPHITVYSLHLIMGG